MNGGVKAGILLGGLALAGCAANSGKLEIRPIADAATKFRQGNVDLAAARGQLALGNVGLALEAYRKINRERPTDPGALAGIGDCYASMGRFDLAQGNYEAALALAPRDPSLLLGLARVFDREGDAPRAIELRAEAARALAPVPTPAPARSVQPPALAAVAPSSSSLPRLPSPAAVPAAQPSTAWPKFAHVGSVTVQLPQARPADRLTEDQVRIRQQIARLVQLADSQPTVTVQLPAARPVAPATPEKPVRLAMPVAIAPAARIERISPGEVMLVTTAQPLWQSQIVSRSLASTTVRWVPLRGSAAPNVQVLNAARHQGLAAAARFVLVDRGWRKIAIGNAPAIRQRSIVLYPKNRAALGRSLAAQFGIDAQLSDGDFLLLILGRDSVGRVRPQRKS